MATTSNFWRCVCGEYNCLNLLICACGRSKPNENHRPPQSPKPEPLIRHEPMAEEKREDRHPERIRVCVTSFRTRLLDPDNLCPKYFIDCLRYAGIIPNDTSEDIELTVRQVKVKSNQERTEIEIEN